MSAIPATKTSGLAITSLVLGCLSIFLGPFTGFPAIITGHIAYARLKNDPALSGRGLAIAGFTLGYVFSIFISIILLFSVLSVFSTGTTSTPRATVAHANLVEISAKLESYRMYAGQYPSTAQGIDALVTEPTTAPLPRRWKQQFTALPLDPWGNAFFYTYHPSTDTYSLASSGPDGTISTGDDITPWP